MSDSPIHPPLSVVLPCTPTFHVLAGSPGAGKSVMVSQLIECILTGQDWLVVPNDLASDTRITYVFMDRPLADAGGWLKDKDLLDRINVLDLAGRKDLDSYRHMAAARVAHGSRKVNAAGAMMFEELIVPACNGEGLVVVDTGTKLVGNIHDGESVNVNAERIMRALNEKYPRMRLLLLTYGVKTYARGSQYNYEDPIDRIIGAAEFRGAASTRMYLGAPIQNEAQELVIAPRRARRIDLRIKQEDGRFVVVLDEDSTDEKMLKGFNSWEDLVGKLPDGEFKTSDVGLLIGDVTCGGATQRLLGALVRRGLVVKVKYGTWLKTRTN